MRIIRLHKRPTPDLGTAERCVKRLPESSTGTGNSKPNSALVELVRAFREKGGQLPPVGFFASLKHAVFLRTCLNLFRDRHQIINTQLGHYPVHVLVAAALLFRRVPEDEEEGGRGR